MTDLEKLKAILDNQQERGVASGDWNRCEYEEWKDNANGRQMINVPADKVEFIFNRNGRFVGIVNYKE